MDSYKKSTETSFSEKTHEYRDLYIQRDTYLLADVCNNFWNSCLQIYCPYFAHFLYASGLASQAA